MESQYESHNSIINRSFAVSIHNRNNDDNIHWHENLEILYFIGGECAVINGSEEIRVKKGDIIIVNSEDIHGIRFYNGYAQYILVHLDHTFCEEMGFNTNDTRFKKKITDSEINCILEKAIAEENQKLSFYEESIKIMLLSVLLLLFRKHIAPNPKDDKTPNKIKLTKKIIKYINKHYDEQITIETIESYCRYSRYYISRAFKETTGLTIMTFVNDVRIEKAKLLLTNSDLSMGNIALSCGFVSQSYFGKVFKKSVGISPLDYKNKMKA